MRQILLFIAAAQLVTNGPNCSGYKRPVVIDIDRISELEMSETFVKYQLKIRRHLICPGLAAALVCPDSGSLSMQKAQFVESDKRCRAQGIGGVDRKGAGDVATCPIGNPLPILQSRCSPVAHLDTNQSRTNCTVDSNPHLYSQIGNSSSTGGSPACQLPINQALSVAYFCLPRLQYLLICAGTRRVIECSGTPEHPKRLAIVYARQTSRYKFPEGGAECPDTVDSQKGDGACREANVTSDIRRYCRRAGEAASSCSLEPELLRSRQSCAPHHLLVIFACVPEHYYSNMPQEVSTGQQKSMEENEQWKKPIKPPDLSAKSGADVAQNDQGGGRQQLAEAAAAGAAAGEADGATGVGQESPLRRGNNGANAGNEREDIILISATASVVGVLLLATCIAFIVVIRLRASRRHRQQRKQIRRTEQQQLRQIQHLRQHSTADRIVSSDVDNLDLDSIDEADAGSRHPALVAAASPVPPPPPPQLDDDEEVNPLSSGCYLLPSPPLPPPPPLQQAQQQQFSSLGPSAGSASLDGPEQLAPRHQLPLLAASANAGASPPGSVSSADAGSGYASASSSGCGGGAGSGGGSTVRFSQFSDLYFYQPNSSPSPMPASTAAAAGGRQLEGVREEEPTVYTPRGVSYV